MTHSADGTLIAVHRKPLIGATVRDMQKFQAALATAEAERAEHARLRFWDHHGRWLVPIMFAGAVAFWIVVFNAVLRLLGWLA